MTPRHLLEPGRLAGAALLKAQSDARLVDMTRAGNDRAFEAIVERYKGQLLRYCARILPDGRGEDAVQQTFLKAYDALHRDTTPLSLRSWLFGIAHNVSLNILRQRDMSVLPASPARALDATESAHATLERRERFREVLAAVAALPPGQRDALLLRELEGRGHDEIARELGVTGGAARQLISRARSGIRAAAAAFIPFPLLMRLTDGTVAPPTAARLAELTAAGGGVTLAKVAATAAVGGTLIGGAVKGPDVVSPGRDDGGNVAAAADERSSEAADGPQAARAAAGGDARARTRKRRGDRRGDGREAATGEDRGERSGSGDDDSSERERGGDDDHSGPGGGDDDHSGPGGGDDDRRDGSSGGDGSNSGPGGGGDATSVEEDHSGPGGGGDTTTTEEDHSGPGGGGSDDPEPIDLTPSDDPITEPDNSGPGGGGTD
jgi:RNA polymerase sigma factor (sigma-70 family)